MGTIPLEVVAAAREAAATLGLVFHLARPARAISATLSAVSTCMLFRHRMRRSSTRLLWMRVRVQPVDQTRRSGSTLNRNFQSSWMPALSSSVLLMSSMDHHGPQTTQRLWAQATQALEAPGAMGRSPGS